QARWSQVHRHRPLLWSWHAASSSTEPRQMGHPHVPKSTHERTRAELFQGSCWIGTGIGYGVRTEDA
ncbi:MAG: hypothetical protein ACRETL_01395, partial [Gammaproteobacteria bacterium]